jgi:sugar phosphate isomerase/epimerase
MAVSLAAIPIAYATASAGMHPSHTLPNKLRALARAGFTAAEIAFPDLEAYAASLHDGYKHLDDAGRGDLDALLGAAHQIRALMEELGVRALTVMPYVHSRSAGIESDLDARRFSEFEGYEDPATQMHNLDRARAWFRVLNVRLHAPRTPPL